MKANIGDGAAPTQIFLHGTQTINLGLDVSSGNFEISSDTD